MKITFNYICLLVTFITVIDAADKSQIQFVTRLVDDAKDNLQDYMKFVKTATESIPADFTSLAKQVQTYQDDSYTTLIDKENINVSQLQSFATGLPWYKERIAGDSSSDSDSDSNSNSDSSNASSTSETSTSENTSADSIDSSTKSTATGEATRVYAPVGIGIISFILVLL